MPDALYVDNGQIFIAGADLPNGVRSADPEMLRLTFLWRTKRTVTRQATLSLQGNVYSIDPAGGGQVIELRYDPFRRRRLTNGGLPRRGAPGHGAPGRQRYNQPMAEIPLYDDTEEVPVPLARDAVRITSLAIRPYADGRRMKLSFSLTPFLERPSLDLAVTNPAGQEVASLSLIEAMDTHFDFTVHLRGPEPSGAHDLRLTLFYLASDEPGAARQVVDERSLSFSPAPEAAP